MAIIEIRGGPITRKYLEKKSKFDLITEYLRLLERIQEQDGLIKSLQSQLSKATQEAEQLRKERDELASAVLEYNQLVIKRPMKTLEAVILAKKVSEQNGNA